MSVDTNVQQLIINNLTKEQYEAAIQAGTINDNELYMVTDENYITADELANVATSGEYSDLVNKPSFSNVAISGNYADLTNTPNFANVAISGNYADLTNTPTVDQTYNASSPNAQSGVAVNNALSGYLKNLATGTGSLTVGGQANPNYDSTNLGLSSQAGSYSVSVGEDARATGTASIALGGKTRATGNNGLALGRSASASAEGAIALGAQAQNSEPLTFKVALTNATDLNPAVDESTGLFTMLNSAGIIPDGRLSVNIARTNDIPNVEAYTSLEIETLWNSIS